jgi:hypothetical protein
VTIDWLTAANPSLELELGDIKRRDPLPLALLEALDSKHGRLKNQNFVATYDRQRTTQVKQPWYQKALDYHSELEEKAPSIQDRAAVRWAIVEYLRSVVVPWATTQPAVSRRDLWIDYEQLAQKLADARPIGIWGMDCIDETGSVQWCNRAGLVKLCPDDAREEQQRVSKLYTDRLEMQDELGHVLRSAVFTLPNFPQWHLAAGVDDIMRRFRDSLLYATDDGRPPKRGSWGPWWNDPRRLFPDIIGGWACLEAPLSAQHATDRSQSWNVHLNVVLVFRRLDELRDTVEVNGMTLPDYAPIEAAWGSIIHWHRIPAGDRDAIQAALRELIKYPLQTVGEKSGKRHAKKFDRHGREIEPAPPMIAWPAECFHEWWQAFHGVRRTRSWGCLYSQRVELPDGVVIEIPKPARRNPDLFEPMGSIKLSPAMCVVSFPMPDTRELDRRQRADARERSGLHLIQGDYSAGGYPDSIKSQSRGPPHDH